MAIRRQLPLTVGLLITFMILTNVAAAVTIVPSISGGLMQQPTSNYYLACYGLNIDAETKDSGFIARGTYVERPKFSSDGFSEQDRSIMGFLGTTALKDALFTTDSVRAFIGGGQVSGYVKKIRNSTTQVAQLRTYNLPGLAASVEYALRLKSTAISLGHTTFIGFAGSEQTSALVAWPYNFYSFAFGFML